MTSVILQKGDFMKKQLTVALGLAVLATPAFATKARLQALGEDTYGSFYVNDNRNIWLNAAAINNHRDLVTYEFGNTNVQSDSAAAPRAEGGVYKQAGNLVYGVHFGGAQNTSNTLRNAAGIAKFEENNLDLFVGGDTGLKWGANLGYSKSKEDQTAGKESQSALRSRLGVIAGDTQGYANIDLMNKAQNSTNVEYKGKLSYQLGVIQSMNGYSLFGEYRDFRGSNDTTNKDLSHKRIQLGAGRVTRLNDRTNLFTRLNLDWTKSENDGSTADLGTCSAGDLGLGCKQYKSTSIPAVIGLETEATSWLTLRASVGQSIWGKEEGKSNSRGVRNTTFVNAGASLKFGELSIDGVIGNNDISGGATPSAAGTTTGTVRTDQLLTRVGMTYRF